MFKISSRHQMKQRRKVPGNINTNLNFFELIGRPSVVAQQNADLLEIIRSFDTKNYTPSTGYTGDVVDIDMRSEFNQ